jgi:HEAT repeat protein
VTDTHLARVQRILDKLTEVKQRRLSCFASDHHHFRLNPPLSEADLRRFETVHAIELPSCYRAFVQHVGNGGAGPYYGIYPLDKWNDFAEWVLDDVPSDFLSRPSPLQPGRNVGLETGSDADLLSAYQGTLSIGTQGCTYAMQLILSGPHRCRVAYVDADGQPPYVVRDPDFLSWYERWLDELLSGYEISWFGFGPAGGEAEFFAILADPHSDDEIKGEAACAFARLPCLPDAAATQITDYLSHPLANVRVGACAAVRKFAILAGIERAAELLGDPSPQVRCEAVRTLMQLVPDRWADAVSQMMHQETDSDVASSAFRALKDANKLAKVDLLKIIQSSKLDRLRSWAVQALEWSAEDKHLAIALLNDPDGQVRLYAALGLRRMKIPLTAPALIDSLGRERDPTIIDHLLKMLGGFADPSTSDVLLKWAKANDDFHRLDALEGLCRIGDERAAEVARAMLQEKRKPVRRDARGIASMTHSDTIQTLVQRMLRDSPSRTLRRRAGRSRVGWWSLQ